MYVKLSPTFIRKKRSDKFVKSLLKQFFDFSIALIGLIILSPLLLIISVIIWSQDKKSPFYISDRVGKNGELFKLIKFRSMIHGADKTGIDSTSTNDYRITYVGRYVRKYKVDELLQLLNVLKGDMSLVGPRPNVKRETDIYTDLEKKLLLVKPGVTDLSSIVFSDEGTILSGERDPDIAYNQLIRPGKSKLGLFYIEHQSLWLDVRIIILTLIAIASRRLALKYTVLLLQRLGANSELVTIASRKNKLIPLPPPGSNKIVVSRFE